jgi:chromate transporter
MSPREHRPCLAVAATRQTPSEPAARQPAASLGTVVREWGRIGLTGFGGPPAHIALLRSLMVDRRTWMDERHFEDANAACGLLPGPASTQLAIFCAYAVRGRLGAVVGGLCFVVPAVVLMIGLSVLFLASSPPITIQGAGAGASAALAAVALQAARALVGPSWARRAGCDDRTGSRIRWIAYLLMGGFAAGLIGPYLVFVLLGSGMSELMIHRGSARAAASAAPVAVVGGGGASPLAWVAFKVGALSYGGGFVVIPLMRGDAVHIHHWMSEAQFLNAVALGQVTPGPVVATIAAVGWAAHGLSGAVLAAAVAFLPSFLFVLAAGRCFENLRGNADAQAFLDGAGPAAIGAIFGAAVLLARALSQPWQVAVLAGAGVAMLWFHRGVVQTLLVAGAIGVVIALAGGPV